MLGTLAEGISDDWAGQLMDQGIVPLCGFEHGLRAISLAARPVPNAGWSPWPAHPAPLHRQLVDEADAKSMLSAAGIAVPTGRKAAGIGDLAHAAAELQAPLVLKGLGHAHKSEAGLVRLSLMPDELADAAASMTGANGFLVEEMARPPVAELLLGVQRDPVYGATLTIGAGGTAAELLRDVVTLVLPVDAGQIRAAIDRLTLAPLLHGYRGRPAGDIDAAVDVAVRLTGMLDHFQDSHPAIDEIEINPLMLGQTGAIAVDAVIWMGDTVQDEAGPQDAAMAGTFSHQERQDDQH
jgi:succinyl-CoA synthetase beta subunit